MTGEIVVVLGIHREASFNGGGWKTIMLGSEDGPTTLAGRASKGLAVAVEYGAQQILFGTGFDEDENVRIKQGEEMLRALDPKMLASITHSIDKVSKNTLDECERALGAAVTLGLDLILVTSSWHMPRAFKEAQDIRFAMIKRGEKVPRLIPEATHEPSAGVIIVEPPHREGVHSLHVPVAKAYEVLKDPASARSFMDELTGLIDGYLQKPEDNT